jgi:excisionase family DNA binding protein
VTAVASPYLTAAEAIAYLKLPSVQALYRLIRDHGLPTCRVGRRYRFDQREVDAWARGFNSDIDRWRAAHPDGRRRNG